MARRPGARLRPQIQSTEQGARVTCRRSPRLHPQIKATDDGAGVSRRRTSPASLPDDDDMLREILIRLPALPSSLPRASAVCKRWRGLVTDPRFLREFYARHRNPPPLLGVFYRRNQGKGIAFSPILDPPDRIPPRRLSLGRCGSGDGYSLLDCRHGLVLVKNSSRTEFLVCDPVTGEQRRVPVPPELKTRFFNGAVLCAAGHQGHVHGGCHSTPFKVVVMSTYKQYNQPFARVYSSETGIWGDRILTEAPCEISRKPAVQVGGCLYWLSIGDNILEFDLGEHSLTVIRGPPLADGILFRNCQIIQAENGAVGYAVLSYPRFEVWQRSISAHGVATWVMWKTVDMHTILRLPHPHDDEMSVRLLGYDEDDAVFLCYDGSVYMVQIKSMQAKKLNEIHSTGNLCFPFKSFFTPGAAIAGRFGAAMLQIE
uniref:Uncharacterized protein n=1 Tax=Avena sativa TaxID=4498 RepID=A0ACD5TSS0_AVESA